MYRLTITLPDAVHDQLKRLAREEGIPVKQYVSSAIARHIEIVEAGLPTVSDLLVESNGQNGTSKSKSSDDDSSEALAS